MNQNLMDRIIQLMKRKMRSRGWRVAVTCMSAVVVFVTAYALVLPGITKTGSYPSLQAEEVTAVSGEELTVRVTAKADAGEEEKTVILIADGEGADLSASYVFNEDGICVIVDETGKEIELHRSVRENGRKKQVTDYWFTLSSEEETSFTLELIDEVDQNRFAKLVEAVQGSAAQASGNEAAAAGENGAPGTASASDAEKAAPAAAATSSNASRATGSNADVDEANAAVKDPEERIETEENDSGFVEILDGKVVNDLAGENDSDDEDEEKVRASLRLSAGIGNDYTSSVKDAERNADKRGDAELKFTWTEKLEESRLLKQDLTVSVGDAKIAVICGDETVLPADARISAYEIAPGTPEYEALAVQAAGAVAESAGGNEKSVTRARFFDITIYDRDGNEIQPEGDVKVVITYEKQNASGDDGEMNVVHFGEDGPEVVDLDEVDSAPGRDSMEFTASSFSIYGAVYTVDSEDEVNSTDQPEAGEKSTLEDSRQAAVQSSNEQGSDDLADFVSNVLITGAVQNEDGKYQVEAEKEYSVIITFAESAAHQFLDREELTYQMPAGIRILSEQTGTSVINIVYRGRTYPVNYSYDLGTDGKLKIRFDQTDPDFPRLEDSTNVSFRFTYYGMFDGSEKEILFAQDIERDIIFDEPGPGNAFAQKSAAYDETTGRFTYTVKVTADGDVADVNVRDVITGNALIFNNDIRVAGNSSSFTDNGAVNGFDYTFASMNEGEEITITYTANVDFSKDTDKDGRISVDQTKNTVTVKPGSGDPHTSEYSREITFKTTSKSDGTAEGKTEAGDKIILWTIDYNPLALAPAGGDKITDSIDAGSAAYMKYYGGGITVEVRDQGGNPVRTEEVPYTSLTSYSDSTWTYTIPAADTTPYSYKITYRTVVDMAKVDGGGVAVSLGNKANNDYGGVYVTPDNEIGIVKEAESFTTEEVNWAVTLSVPEGGLVQAVVTDTFPIIRLDDGVTKYSDLFKEGSLQITGLLPGESYTPVFSGGNVVITFYKDAEKKMPGLQGTAGGHAVTIRLTTTVDQDWLQKGYETGGREQNHTNTVVVNNLKTAAATVTYSRPGIEKSVNALPDGSFMYTILLSGVSEVPVKVDDTFDTSLLEVDTSMAGVWGDHMKIWGGTQWSQTIGKTAVSYTDTQNGILLTANSVPMQEDGHYYPYYRIVYYLKLKEGVDLEALAIANGGEHDLVNTAKWNGHETSCTYKTEYDYLDKKLLNEGKLGGTERTAKYQITFNKARAVLNEGEPMTMTDILSSNLSVDYGSIEIETDPEGINVPYSLRGNDDGSTAAAYTVPDATKVVITYDAEVRGNGSQTIVNKVSVKGKDKTVTATESFGSASEGEGAVASFKIVKVDGYDANKKLSGVRFRVFAEDTDPNINFGPKAGNAKEIELVTDENGEIWLDGDEYRFYFDKVYHIQETEAPEGYGTVSFDYLVTLTNDMAQVDYKHFIYYFSDSMQIKNWPLEGLVVEKQVESDDPADKEQYYQFRISILNEDGSVNTEYNEENGDDQFEDGIFEFELKDKEQKMFWGFRKGTKYLVEETDAKGLDVSVRYSVYDEDGNITETAAEDGNEHTGILTRENEVIIFKNTNLRKGDLEISKKLISEEEADSQQSFLFTVTLGDNTITGLYGDVTFTDGTAAVELKGGESVTAEGLPAGITYEVTEAESEGFELIGVTGNTGTITGVKKSEAVFTNARKDSLQISTQFEAQKTIRGRALREDEAYSFQLLDADGTLLQEKTNDPSGMVTFDPVVFTASDLPAVAADSNAGKEEKTMTYRIREVIPSDAADNIKDSIKYDTSEYSVSVTLSYNYETGEYAVSDPVYKAGEEEADAAVFINEELCDFEFSKVWMNSGKDVKWPESVGSITVTLKRTALEAGGDQTEETAVFTVTPDSITENDGSGFTAPAEKLAGEDYRYKITDLAKYRSNGTEWIYSISETAVEGFNKPAYYTINADGIKEEQLSSEKTFFAVPGTTGGVEIVNDEILLELPSTGGPGTMLYTLGGTALLIVSALMYIFRMRKQAMF